MRGLLKREEGFTLAWLAMILFLLLAMAGFGTDLGWIYLNTVRTQNAVDAAALAGVVNLPSFDPTADAEAAVQANGFDPSVDTLILKATHDNELHAELSTSIEPFFMRVLGFTHFDITRESTARYIKPVPLGSPSSCFGGGLTSECPSTERFWGAVSGKFSLLEDGDPYSTLCDENDASGCTSDNDAYARGDLYRGYYYGVDVPSGTTDLDVLIYNSAFDTGGLPGDSNFMGPNEDIDATFELHRPDTTPLIPYDHIDGTLTPECTISSPTSGWASICTNPISNPDAGIWLVHIEATAEGAGSNNFAIRATGSPTAPRVYGINDMSIWSDNLVQGSELYIAEVTEEHAGKKLELAFYDAGDARAESWYHVLQPNGDLAQCSWKVYTAPYPDESAAEVPSLSSDGVEDCEWQTQTAGAPGHQGVYNKHWIVATIDLPEDPDDMCAGTGPAACFWKMELDLSDPIERTTWRARVIGNPVQLVPTPASTTTTP